MRFLMRHDVLDEYRHLIYPVGWEEEPGTAYEELTTEELPPLAEE